MQKGSRQADMVNFVIRERHEVELAYPILLECSDKRELLQPGISKLLCQAYREDKTNSPGHVDEGTEKSTEIDGTDLGGVGGSECFCIQRVP